MPLYYEDSQIRIDEVGIGIRDYYFPTYGAKNISWSELKSVHEFDLTFWSGKYRIWGMGLRPWWFNYDWRRQNKKKVFVLDSGSYFKSAITPEKPEELRAVFRSRSLLPLQ